MDGLTNSPTERAFEKTPDPASDQHDDAAKTVNEEPAAKEVDSGAERRQTSSRPVTTHWSGVGIRLFILLLIGALVIVVAREWDWWAGSAILQRTDDAYLKADLTPLAAKVPGYVKRVLAQDYQKVRAGDVLVEIVDDDYRAQLAQAQADVAAARAAIENIEQQKLLQKTLVKQAEADIKVSEADLTRYHLETLRQKALLAHRIAGTPQATEQAVDNEDRTLATRALNRAKLEQQSQQLNVLDSQMKQAIASLDAKQAARNLAEINLGS
jgi:membrane fusion protein (multidrug efflux system)